MIKLVALDLDGTLLNSQHKVSEENKQALKKAQEKGVHVVLCTGRPLLGIRHLLEELDLLSTKHYSIAFNGGLVQITGTQEILFEKTLSKEDVVFIYRELYQAGLPANAIDLQGVYEPTYPTDNPSLYPSIMTILPFKQQEFSTFSSDRTFNKVVSGSPQELLDERMKCLPEAFFKKYAVMKSRPVLLEVMPKGVDKGVGLQALCQYLGLSFDEVMAIGDEENDLAMLKFAKYSIAMGNAPQFIQDVAYDVTATNDEHGVARAIEKYIL